MNVIECETWYYYQYYIEIECHEPVTLWVLLGPVVILVVFIVRTVPRMFSMELILQTVFELIIEILRKFMSSNADYNSPVRSQFCTCHDSSAVVACAKLWHELTTTFRIFTIPGSRPIDLLWNRSHAQCIVRPHWHQSAQFYSVLFWLFPHHIIIQRGRWALSNLQHANLWVSNLSWPN